MNEQPKRTLKDAALETLWKINERHNALNDRRSNKYDSLDFWGELSTEEVMTMHQDRLLLLTLAEALIAENSLGEETKNETA